MSDQHPPEYASILQGLGTHPTPAQAEKAMASLAALSIEPPPSYEPPKLTSEQLKKYSAAIITGMSSTQGNEYIKNTIKLANETTKQTDTMFANLTVKLAEIDAQFTSPASGPFKPKLVAIKNKWFNGMLQSRDLANKIASYGSRFASLIIPLAEDKDKSTDFKLKKLQEFIDKAHEFETDSTNLISTLNEVNTDFQSLVGTFSQWAAEKSEELKKKLKTLEDEMKILDKAITDKTREMIGVGAGLAATLPVTGIAAALAGPFAPFVIIGGLVAAGALLTTFLVLQKQLSDLKDDKSRKQKEIDAVKLDIKKIDDARKELVALGTTNLVTLQGNISAMTNFWTYARGDAVKIQSLLKDAKSDIDWPEAFYADKDAIITLYKQMSEYLSEYAHGMPLEK